MVYRPRVKDTRKALMGTDCPGLSQYCILADGRITALAGYDSFKQFDGKTWRPMKSAEASKLGMNLETYRADSGPKRLDAGLDGPAGEGLHA